MTVTSDVSSNDGTCTLREARSPFAPILLPVNRWMVAAAVLTV